MFLILVKIFKAEKIATQMISEEKIRGVIDQLEQTVSFEGKGKENRP